MDELLLISSLGIVSTARSPQLKSSGAATEEAGYSLITYQVN
jgi:hypothetical protein